MVFTLEEMDLVMNALVQEINRLEGEEAPSPDASSPLKNTRRAYEIDRRRRLLQKVVLSRIQQAKLRSPAGDGR